MYLWFGSVCVRLMESACSPLREYETVRAAAPVLKRAGNGIGFSKGEMEVGKGMEADRAWAMAKTALEELDEHLRTIGPQRGGGGVASSGGGVSGNGRYIECNID